MMGEISRDDLGYADEFGSLENTVELVAVKLQSLSLQSRPVGMEINVGKMKPCTS